MKCPKCRKNVSDEDYECPYCGTKIKSQPEKTSRRKISAKVSKKTENSEKPEKERKSPFFKRKPNGNAESQAAKSNFISKFKILFTILCLVIIAILVAVIIFNRLSSKGEKYAETASGYIGYNLKTLEGSEDMHFSDESKYFGVNSTVAFDYIMESDKKIKSNGISYPKWAVTLKLSDSEFITDVTYTDFSVIEKDLRGEKNDSQISLDSFDKGEKQTKVLNYIDMSPYSISYSQSGITLYTFKYYFKRDDSDEQQVILRVAFNEKGKYQYYTSELIFPENM